METITKTTQKIQLVDGIFTPSETADVVLALLNEKINFHKLQRISWCEGSVDADTEYPDGRIAELEKEKAVTKEFVAQVRHMGKKLRINGILEIAVED
ncbi:MAG: hypothetical protein AAF717_03985 [Bacteroidota bacterium]